MFGPSSGGHGSLGPLKSAHVPSLYIWEVAFDGSTCQPTLAACYSPAIVTMSIRRCDAALHQITVDLVSTVVLFDWQAYRGRCDRDAVRSDSSQFAQRTLQLRPADRRLPVIKVFQPLLLAFYFKSVKSKCRLIWNLVNKVLLRDAVVTSRPMHSQKTCFKSILELFPNDDTVFQFVYIRKIVLVWSLMSDFCQMKRGLRFPKYCGEIVRYL